MDKTQNRRITNFLKYIYIFTMVCCAFISCILYFSFILETDTFILAYIVFAVVCGIVWMVTGSIYRWVKPDSLKGFLLSGLGVTGALHFLLTLFPAIGSVITGSDSFKIFLKQATFLNLSFALCSLPVLVTGSALFYVCIYPKSRH